jgi:hypothetical protein
LFQVPVKSDLDEHRYRQINGRGIDDSRIFFDNTGLLESRDSSGTYRRRQAEAIRNVCWRVSRIILQLSKNPPIDVIELGTVHKTAEAKARYNAVRFLCRRVFARL